MAKKIKVQNVSAFTLATLSDYNASRVQVARLQVAKKNEIKAIRERIEFLESVLVDEVPKIDDKNAQVDLRNATNDEIATRLKDIEALENGYRLAVKPLNKNMNTAKKTVPSELFTTYSAVVSEGSEEAQNQFSLACMKWLVSMGCEGIDETSISKFGSVFATIIGGTRRNTAENITDGQTLRVAYTENTFRSLAVEGLIDYLVNVMGAFIINGNDRLDLKYKEVKNKEVA